MSYVFERVKTFVFFFDLGDKFSAFKQQIFFLHSVMDGVLYFYNACLQQVKLLFETKLSKKFKFVGVVALCYKKVSQLPQTFDRAWVPAYVGACDNVLVCLF